MDVDGWTNINVRAHIDIKSSIANICNFGNVSDYFMFAVRDEWWWWWWCWALRWLTHTNVFLIFPVGAFGDKNYINTSIDAPRRDTSTAVIGIANRARIKKLIFRILVIKSMKTVFTRASSEFWLFSKFAHTTAYCPIDLWRGALKR
jgi:hypothetical protein